MTTFDLPAPVVAFIEATNSFDLEAFMRALSDDALVNDHRDEFIGEQQIRAWARREIIGDRVTLAVMSASRRGGAVAVTVSVDGNFDKSNLPSPLLLTFYFSVTDDKIVQLVIVPNKSAADGGKGVPAYFVYVCQEVINRAELEVYWDKIGPTLAGYGAKNLAAYTPFEPLEGEPVDGVAVIEFPSRDVAKAWYDSAPYRAIRHHRQNGARYIGLLVEGGALPPELRMPRTRDRGGRGDRA
jgi:uncharacterized protein (DUF1330 family)